MKNFKIFLSIFAIVALLTTTSNAQVTSDVDVTAQVEAALGLTPTAVALGTIQTGLASVIDANTDDDATEANIGTGASAGSLAITGTSGASIDVSWNNATLSNGSDPITFTPSVWLGASELTTPGGSTVSITGGSITLDVGGELAAPSGTGAYTTVANTPITFTVSYN